MLIFVLEITTLMSPRVPELFVIALRRYKNINMVINMVM